MYELWFSADGYGPDCAMKTTPTGSKTRLIRRPAYRIRLI